MRKPLASLAAILLLALTLSACQSNTVSIKGTQISLTYETLGHEQVREMAAEADRIYAAIKKYLGRPDAEKIDITYRHGGSTRYSAIFTESRRHIDVAAAIVTPEEVYGVLAHEMVHAAAGDAYLDNLFLSEGLALHIELAENRWSKDGSPENANEDLKYLDELALSVIEEHEDSSNPVQEFYDNHDVFRVYLDDDQQKDHPNRGDAYYVAGSFVGYLVKWQGIKKFMALYDSGNFEKVYGYDLGTLASAWRTAIGQPKEGRKFFPVKRRPAT